MTKFTDNLWRDLVQEHGAALAQAGRPGPGRARRPRPRVLAGSTLALAGVGAAIALVLTSTSSTPAFAAVTVAKVSDGSVLVKLNKPAPRRSPRQTSKLAAMGFHEGITIYMASGAGRRQRSGHLHARAGRTGPADGEGSRGHERHGGHRPGHPGQHRRGHLAPASPATSRVTPAAPATRAPADPVTAAGARRARAPAMARLAVRPPGSGAGPLRGGRGWPSRPRSDGTW